MESSALGAERLLSPLDRRLEGGRAGADRHIVEGLGEGGPIGIHHLAGGELIERLARDRTETVSVEILEGDTDDMAARDEASTAQAEQARQQLARRQIAGGADEHDDLRILRTDAARNSCHGAKALMRMPSDRGGRAHHLNASSITVLRFGDSGRTHPVWRRQRLVRRGRASPAPA